MNDLFSGDIPMGFGMALAENMEAVFLRPVSGTPPVHH